MDTDSLSDLTPPETLQLVEDLWDDLAAQPSDVPIHDWQKAELDRRKTNLSNNTAPNLPLPDVKARIRNKHGR